MPSIATPTPNQITRALQVIARIDVRAKVLMAAATIGHLAEAGNAVRETVLHEMFAPVRLLELEGAGGQLGGEEGVAAAGFLDHGEGEGAHELGGEEG